MLAIYSLLNFSCQNFQVALITSIFLWFQKLPQRLRRRTWSSTTFQHYIGYVSHYIYTVIVRTEEKKERQDSDTERHGIPPQPPWFFYVPGVQLRYMGLPFYVPIRRTMMNTMDIYNEKMNDMWEPAPGITLFHSSTAPSTNIDIFKANPSDENEL